MKKFKIPRAHRHVHSRMQGLTLPELLIIVAITAVLVSLLWPGLGAITEAAKASRCVANLSQLFIAFQASAADHNGIISFHRRNAMAIHSTRRWNDYLAAGGYITAESDVQTCPGALPRRFEVSGFVYGGIGTVSETDEASFVPDDAEDGAGRVIRLSAIKQPAGYWLLGDSWSKAYGKQLYAIEAQATPANGIHLRHRDRANLLFADGHVQAMGARELAQLPVNPLFRGFNRQGRIISF